MRNMNSLSQRLICAFLFLGCFSVSFGQDPVSVSQSYVRKHATEYGVESKDLRDLKVTDLTNSKDPLLYHVYMRQAVGDVGIYKAEMNLTLTGDGKVAVAHVNAFKNAQSRINATAPSLSPVQAMAAASRQMGWPAPEGVEVMVDDRTGDESRKFSRGNISLEDIPCRLVYMPVGENDLRLSWDFSILQLDEKHWWSLKVDAVTGEILEKVDWTTHCRFDNVHANGRVCHPNVNHDEDGPSLLLPPPPNSYNVYPTPIESPNFGARSIVSNPWDLVASPYGWHDTNGANGAEYTITRGNNVWAQEDANGNNGTGYSPSGGTTLNFDFPLNLNGAPSTYRDAAITNLFYWNNRVHDVWYRYGFDEVSGNFQQNNYGRGGAGNDYVLADAQDGSGMDNANFSTPADGQSGRMQMYLWTGQSTVNFVVNSPSTVAGTYYAVQAGFGPNLPVTPLTRNLVLVSDGTAAPTLGCNALTNAAQVSGKIALIDRGTCTFVSKVQNAQNAGAVACVVCNNVAGTPIVMGGTTTAINIPSVMISQADCALLKAQLAAGVNVSLSSPGVAYDRDGDIDNGVIAHEYGHGVSTRLTGGPSNSNCLNNAEQMGEGWSDWIGLMMTIQPGDLGTDVRGIGTYVVFEPSNGTGIRPAPYTTDMNVNPYTYIDIQNTTLISQPHGIGFLWCNMLWEMTWLLIDQYGFDPNLETGTGGNNIAMKLVTQGMKMQPCSPGFVDGRNAILEADTLLYGGQYSCLIWEAFAKRGLGVGASQGSSSNRSDGTQSFVRPACVAANFSANVTSTCQGSPVSFSDQTAGSPTAWLWSFGDGQTSTQQNPVHTYNTPGTYNVSLQVTVGGNSNTLNRPGYIVVHPNPTATANVSNATCGNANGSLTLTPSNGLAPYTYQWSTGGTTASISGLAPGNYTVTVSDSRTCASSQTFTVGNASGPIASVQSTTGASCGTPNGTATATATGGTGNLAYAWSNGQNTAVMTGVAAGSYTVTVTDQNGCTSTAVASISNSNGPSASVNNSTATTCGQSNGSATVSASGGTGNLSYLWSNGGTTATVGNLSAGTYTVTVTDQANCIAVTSVNIGASTPPVAQVASSTPASCGQSNGTITASAIDGTAPYQFAWSTGATTPSISGLGGGVYSVTITDNAGCTSSTSLNLPAYTQPAVQVVTGDLTCFNQNNGTATANPSGGLAPYSYNWNTGQMVQQITGLPSAMYLVTVTDANGCNVIGVGVVNQPSAVTAFLTSTNESASGASDGTATASGLGGTPGYSYDWSNGGTTSTISGLSTGWYRVTVSDTMGCLVVDSVFVGVSVGVESAQNWKFDIVPNPNEGAFDVLIDLPSVEDCSVDVLNGLGQIVWSKRLGMISSNRFRVESARLASGVYYVRLKSPGGSKTLKMVVTPVTE